MMPKTTAYAGTPSEDSEIRTVTVQAVRRDWKGRERGEGEGGKGKRRGYKVL